MNSLPSLVVGVQAQKRERQPRTNRVEGSDDVRFAATKQREALRPTRGHVPEGERVEEAPLRVPPAVGHQVGLQKTGTDVVPVREGPHTNLLSQQAPRPGEAHRPGIPFAFPGQQTGPRWPG